MPELECGFSETDQYSASELLTHYGPTLLVDIGFDSNWKPEDPTPPIASIEQVAALIDTGATESCIDNQLAKQINLPPIDIRKVGGIGGSYDAVVYAAQIHFPQLPWTIAGEFAGVDLVAGGQPHQALIGRTFLRNFLLVYDGTTGRVTIGHP